MEETVNAVASAGRKRTKHKAVCCPLVYGSIAFSLGKKGDEFATHKWTLYVRGPAGEDLSYVLEKAVFKLHPSFSQPIRELTSHPFEVTEKGWGEFEAAIRLHFRDASERPVEMMHVVKLYDGISPQVATRPVVSEVYDEIVFCEPFEDFYEALITRPAKASMASAHRFSDYFGRFDDSNDVEVLVKIAEYVKGQLDNVKSTVSRLDHQILVCRQIEQSRAQAAQQAAQQQKQQATAKAAVAQQQYQPPKSVPAVHMQHQQQLKQPNPNPTPNPAAQAAVAHQQQLQAATAAAAAAAKQQRS